MNSPEEPAPDLAISQEETSRLIRMATESMGRPVHRLIDRLTLVDGPDWFRRMLAEGPVARLGDAEDQLVRGKATLGELVQLKQASKQQFKRRADSQDRLYGMAGYFLSVAAALRHHGKNICSRPRTELEDTLLDLAAAVPEPWESFLSATALHGSHDGGAQA